jgi:PTS system mannose-specific IIA component
MPALVLVTHAPLAGALATVAAHAFPDCASRLRRVDVEPGEDIDQVASRLRELLPASGEVLILTDVFGATPCNAALRVADGQRVRVVAGVNVPMLWRVLCYEREPLEQLVTRAVEGAAQAVMQVSVPRPQNQTHRGGATHGPTDAGHQQ